jgi:Holliday junction resolvase-like predicted endonuclease
MPMAMPSYHVGVAAEAFAAGLFAQAGCDVLVQYGANQPEYDLVVARAGRALHVSVKGSQDGGWGLIQNFKSKEQGYHAAADAWAAAHKNSALVYCLVQFEKVLLGECPRLYLASISDVVERHKASRNGLGSTILWEDYCYKKGVAKGCAEKIPASWRFSATRLEYFFS